MPENKPVMSDLQQAILEVLESACLANPQQLDEYRVEGCVLRELQAEYNIYFVEPDEAQLDVLERG